MITVKTFEITIHDQDPQGSWQRVDLRGFLDAHTVREFDSRMQDLITAGAATVVLGLENLSYISSAGVASLMSLMQKLRNREGTLVILRPSDKVFHVLKTLGFTNIFQIVNDENEVGPLTH
jgi:anti-anti-sigma factor